ncbi:ABC transporter substrate-binding protein [uncultured Microbacterium sp.]|uniref:Extracellular solute-binding protein n=1 Tax=uncultured Microbacterium sp. TaxID=191216 RepID=A0A1Y5P0P8_9MICO|nr:ABC transporter substrate-binding protein [uncultured Microbacterium sp.]SBS72195.1 Extracellular solute-binding protein [uncultured Microbacterium sp.]
MKKTRLLAAGAVTLAAVIAMSGCAGGEAAPEAQPTTLKLTINTPPSSFAIGNLAGQDATLSLSIYDTLVMRDLNNELVAAAAESWEYSEDRRTLTFDIRDGQEFSDGSPLDADAVVASLDLARTGPSSQAAFASISAIEAPDESTVVITLAEPDAALLPNLARPFGAIGAPSVLTEESSQLSPVGSGPYVLDQDATTVGSEYTLTRNPANWNADAYEFDTVKITVIQDPAAVVSATQTGEIDYALVSPQEVNVFPTSEFASGENLPTAIGGLWIVDRAGSIVPALADLRVRQAINMALDRDGIAESLGGGTSTATNQVYSPVDGAFSDQLLDVDAYDPAAARKLLAEAGYADGFDITVPSTVISQTFESIITQQLGEVGVRVTWEPVPFQDFYSKVFAGNYGMFFMYNAISGSDALDTSAVLQGVFNPFNSTTPELDSLLDAANVAAEDDQPESYRAINEYFVDQAWFAPMSYSSPTYVVTRSVDYTPSTISTSSLLPWTPASSE